EDGIRDFHVTGVQTCALPIYEPTGALDSKSSREVIRLLTELSDKGHTVILITHDQDVADVARRQIHISDGEIVKDTGIDPVAIQIGRASCRERAEISAGAE